MITLQDTVTMMTSDNYRDRFIGEYFQTKIRYEKLKALNNKIEAYDQSVTWLNGKPYAPVAEVKHDCPAYLLKDQETCMAEYLHILELRAVYENIDLFYWENELHFQNRCKEIVTSKEVCSRND